MRVRRYDPRSALGVIAALAGVGCGGQRALVAHSGADADAGQMSAARSGAAPAEAAPDAAASNDSSAFDAGTPRADAAVTADAAAPPDAAVAADGGMAPPPLVLADGCDVRLDHRANVPIPGTLPGQGPYRPCYTAGGQRLSPVALSRDGARIAALDALGEAVVMDAATLKTRARFGRLRGPYMTLALSPSGARLAATSPADGELDLFDVDAGTLLQAIDVGPPRALPVAGLAFSPDGARVAVTTGPDVALVDVATGAIRRYTDGTRAYADQVLFVDGGRKLATARYAYDTVGSGSPAVTLLDLSTGGLAVLIDLHDIYGWMNLLASADGATLLAYRGGELHAWEASTGIAKPVGGGFAVRQVLDVDATGSLVAVTSDYYRDGATHLLVHRVADGALVRDLTLDRALTPWLWSLDRDRVVVTAAASDGSGAVRLGVLDTTGTTLARACSEAIGSPYQFASAAPRLVARAGTGLRVYDSRSVEPIGPVLGAGEPINTIALSPDGQWLSWSSFFVASVGTQVTLADATTGEERLIGGPAQTYTRAVPSSGGGLVAIQDTQTRSVSVVDSASQSVLARLDASGVAGGLVGFTPDGNALIVAGGGAVQVVDWRTGTTIQPPGMPALPAAAQAFMAQGSDCVIGWAPYVTFSSDGSWRNAVSERPRANQGRNHHRINPGVT